MDNTNKSYSELGNKLKEKEDEIRDLKDLVERWSASFDKLVESGKERDESLDRMIYLNKQLSKYKALAEAAGKYIDKIQKAENYHVEKNNYNRLKQQL